MKGTDRQQSETARVRGAGRGEEKKRVGNIDARKRVSAGETTDTDTSTHYTSTVPYSSITRLLPVLAATLLVTAAANS